MSKRLYIYVSPVQFCEMFTENEAKKTRFFAPQLKQTLLNFLKQEIDVSEIIINESFYSKKIKKDVENYIEEWQMNIKVR